MDYIQNDYTNIQTYTDDMCTMVYIILHHEQHDKKQLH